MVHVRTHTHTRTCVRFDLHAQLTEAPSMPASVCVAFAHTPAQTHTHTHTHARARAPQLHHLLNSGAEVNQRDERGMTPLHRAAYLSHYDGYLEIYEYLLVRARVPCRACVPLPPVRAHFMQCGDPHVVSVPRVCSLLSCRASCAAGFINSVHS